MKKNLEIVVMNKIYLVAVSLLVLFLSCSERTSDTKGKQSTKDTTRIASESPEAMKSRFLSYEQRQGRHLYMKYCVVCHGEEGKGDGFNAFNLDTKPRDLTDAKYMNALSDTRIIETISQGGRGVNKSLLMPTWGGRVSKSEQEYIIAYVRHFAQSSQ